MNTTWINKQGNESCILFFTGWGMDENAVNHINTSGLDVCVFNEYNPITQIEENLGRYKDIYLVAWSMGVWASAVSLSQTEIKITKAIALNGTQRPIDANEGIPMSIFKATLDGWNYKNRNKFNMRIFGGKRQYEQFRNHLAKRDVENQKEELSDILSKASLNNTGEINFDSAFVGSSDLIFLPANQLRHWNGRTRIVKANAPHYPFTIFKSWNEIIEL